MPAPSLRHPDPDLVAALTDEVDAAWQRVRFLEGQLAQVRSSPTYPHAGFARLEMLGDADVFFRKLGQHTVCGVYVYDLSSGHNVYVNPRYTELLGYTLADLDALDHQSFVELYHPDDRENVFAHMVEVGERTEDRPVPIEYRFRHKDGAWVWCRSYDFAFERAPDGRMLRFIGSLVDITDVMEAKEAQAQFARMAAHDLRAPARRIRQYVELLTEELGHDLPADADGLLDAIDQQAARMHALVTGIRRLTGMVPPSERAFVSIDRVVDQVLDALPADFRGTAVHIHRDPLPTLPVYPEFVRTLYANLVANALSFGARPLQLHFTATESDDAVVLGVRNTGDPFPADLLDSVFVPFRRGRRRAAGVGLGLPICKRVVDQHHGRIWIEREHSHTHVRFTLTRGNR